MKVFISWSGAHSKRLGEALRDWLPGVLQAVSPYFTPADIEKGTRWSTDIAKELEESRVGILCVTRDNLHSDWILFEAGALSKSLQKSHVCPVLFGIKNTDLAGPLKQFQTTEFEKADFHRLLTVINGQLGDNKLPSKTLDLVFDKWWPDLEAKIREILADVEKIDEPIRTDRELLEEILQLSRNSLKRGGSSTIHPGAINDLLEKFIMLHDDQKNELGGYSEVLNMLREMSKPIDYIARKLASPSEETRKLLESFRTLTYSFPENGSDAKNDDDDDIPF